MKSYKETIDGMILEAENKIASKERDCAEAQKQIDALRKNSPKRKPFTDMLESQVMRVTEEREELLQMKRFREEIGAIEHNDLKQAEVSKEREAIYSRIGSHAHLIFVTARALRN